MILADAVRRVNAFDPVRIRNALAETKNFEGITGNITFVQHGDAFKSLVILKSDQGTQIFVKSIEP